MFLSRRAPGSQQIKGTKTTKQGGLCGGWPAMNLIDIWDMGSVNRLPRVGNRLQGLKMKIGG